MNWLPEYWTPRAIETCESRERCFDTMGVTIAAVWEGLYGTRRSHQAVPPPLRNSMASSRRRCAVRWSKTMLISALVVTIFALSPSTASANMGMMDTHHKYTNERHQQYTGYQGCALCRGTGNCSHASKNGSVGVYCGDLITTFEPCCCAVRNECMTTIFSDRCECLTEEKVDQFLSARFTMLCVFTAVMWVALMYDRMCARRYKVANSSRSRHHVLPNSPSLASLNGTAPRETASEQELVEIDDSANTDSSDGGDRTRSTTDHLEPSNASTAPVDANTAVEAVSVAIDVREERTPRSIQSV